MKPIDQFAKQPQAKDGRHWWCKACDKKRRDDLRLAAINVFGGACLSCGIRDSRVLQFHHPNLDGKKYSQENGYDRPSYTLYKKIVKGELKEEQLRLLCANCHMIEHRDTAN